MKTSCFLYSTLANDPDLSEIVDMFVDEMPQRINKIRELYHSNNMEELARIAHQLKGAAGSYGFMEIGPFAAKLEEVAQDRLSEAEISKSVDELCEICKCVRTGSPEENQ
jgi:histidine phosphotransfer protein HptB